MGNLFSTHDENETFGWVLVENRILFENIHKQNNINCLLV